MHRNHSSDEGEGSRHTATHTGKQAEFRIDGSSISNLWSLIFLIHSKSVLYC